MDAGVPLRDHVAGISVGVILEDAGKYTLFTDIQGLEDHHGDMDFKVAGTRDGITAIQLDIKPNGVPLEVPKYHTFSIHILSLLLAGPWCHATKGCPPSQRLHT